MCYSFMMFNSPMSTSMIISGFNELRPFINLFVVPIKYPLRFLLYNIYISVTLKCINNLYDSVNIINGKPKLLK